MKTEQIMERDFFGAVIRQRTSDGYINLNDLFEAYNSKSNGPTKLIAEYFRLKSTNEFVFLMTKERMNIGQVFNTYKNTELKSSQSIEAEVSNEAIPVTKLPYETRKGRYNGGTWAHPYLFLDAAMWLSPEFKLLAIKVIHDHLIDFRIAAGDDFKLMNSSLKKYYQLTHEGKEPSHFHYANEIKHLKKLVYGNTEGLDRNQSTEKQLRLLDELQRLNCALFDMCKDRDDRHKALLQHTETFQLLNGSTLV